MSATTIDLQTSREIPVSYAAPRKYTYGRYVAVLVIASISLGVLLVSAAYADTDTPGANGFSTGSVALSTNGATATVTMAAMAPGDTVYSAIRVDNNGSLDLRYAVKSAVTTLPLAQALDLTVKASVAGDDATSSTNSGLCTDEAQFLNTAVFPHTPYATNDLGHTTAIPLFGDLHSNVATGKRVLASDRSEVLCLKVSLPGATTDQTMPATTATFTFTAEQADDQT